MCCLQNLTCTHAYYGMKLNHRLVRMNIAIQILMGGHNENKVSLLAKTQARWSAMTTTG